MVVVFVFIEFKFVVEFGGVVVFVVVLFGKLDLKGWMVGVVIIGGNVDLYMLLCVFFD